MYKKAIIFHLMVLSLSVVFSSCCENVFIITSGFHVSFTDYEKEISISPSQDTIRGPFIYSLDAEIIGSNSHPNGFGLIHSANALSCADVYQNGYQRETASLMLDKSFIFDGRTIPAGTNLLTLDSQFDVFDYNAQVYEYGIRVWFRSEFLKRSTFPLSHYTFIASINMADGTLIESQDTVIMQID